MAGVCVRDTAPFTMIRPVNSRCDFATISVRHVYLSNGGYIDFIDRTVRVSSSVVYPDIHPVEESALR